MAEPAPIYAQNVQLETFERLVYARRYEEAMSALSDSIIFIKNGGGIAFHGQTQLTPDHLFTRFASAIGIMFADPAFKLSYPWFLRLVGDHATLHGIFRASSFGNMDYLLAQVGTRGGADGSQLNFTGDQAIPKMLVCWSLESEIDLDFDTMAKVAPQYAVAALLGLLAIGGVHTQRAYDRKKALMGKRHILEAAPFEESLIFAVGDTYMHCSYVDGPDKHEVKKVLNRQLRALVSSKTEIKESHERRPTIVVPVEWFGSSHAMYRCYAHAIRQLRKRFRLVGIVRAGEVDEAGRAEFDKVVEVSPTTPIRELARAVNDENPDIIYYPSIGMASWWVALSNFRLAPIQIMTPGHPATTHSDVMDYMVSEGALFGDEAQYSETCVHLPRGGARFMPRAGTDWSKVVRPDDGVVRVAVPASVMKLAPPFLAALQNIVLRAGIPVQVHFFPNQVGTSHHLVTRDLESWVPNCVVHPRMEYQPYIEALGQCDVALATFPFGGTNSLIDCFLLGIPVITLEGTQIHDRNDAYLLRRLLGGAAEGLIAQTVEEFEEKALHAITEGMVMTLEPGAVEAEFFGDGPPEVADAWLNAFLDIYGGKYGKKGAVAGNAGGDNGRAGGQSDVGGYASELGQPVGSLGDSGD